jgi:hypothetical protein
MGVVSVFAMSLSVVFSVSINDNKLLQGFVCVT